MSGGGGGMPRVSIGLPVYQAEDTVGRALDSLRAQTFRDLEIVVSDNASTDGTARLCRERAAADPRIRYVRQEHNLGPAANFRFVLGQARAPYFMWAAADDWWAPRYVEANAAVLDARPDVVGSVSRGFFVDGERRWPLDGTYPLEGDVRGNVQAYLAAPGDNSRFYALFRRDALLASVIDDRFLADDWYVVLRTLRFGGYHEVPEPLFFRGARGASGDFERLVRVFAGTGPGAKVLPFRRLTARILADPEIPKTPGVLAALARHNTAGFVGGVRLLLDRAGVPRFRRP